MALALCIGLLVGIGATVTTVGATTTTVDAGQTLFMRDGTHNAALRTQLINFANSIPGVGELDGRQNVDVGGINHVGADAAAIRVANGGDLPMICMFEQRQDSVITGGSSQTLDEAADNFTMQQWLLVYITFPVSGHPIFTFMMTNPYRNQRFNPAGIDHFHNLYDQIGGGVGNPATFMGTEGSEVRNQINYDFGHVLSQFPSINPNIFTAPAGLPGTWQSREPIVTSPNREFHKLDGPRLDDRIWLPSSFELGDGNTGNLWNLASSEMAKLDDNNNGFHDWAWMRSRAADNPDNSRMFSYRVSSSTAINSRGVRPAIHLDMTLLIPALDIPQDVSITRTQNDELTAVWNAVENAVSYRVRVGEGTWQTVNVPATTFAHTISATGIFNFQVYARGDGLSFVDSTVASASITINQEQLVVPSNLQISAGVLSWDSTDSLGTYVVYRNGIAYSSELTTRSWTIPTTWGPATWNLQVRATASSSTWFTDSNLSTGIDQVVQATITGAVITANTTKSNWYLSESFAASGLQVLLTYSDSSTRTVTTGLTIATTTWQLGVVTVSVYYGGHFAGTFTVTVSPPINNYNMVTVNGSEIAIVPGTFYLVKHLAIPQVQSGYEFVGWSTDGGATILEDTYALESGMVLSSVIREIQNGETNGFPWLIVIIGAVAGVILLAGIAIVIILQRRKRLITRSIR